MKIKIEKVSVYGHESPQFLAHNYIVSINDGPSVTCSNIQALISYVIGKLFQL